jgi:polyhydroxybutyrate depolymerase
VLLFTFEIPCRPPWLRAAELAAVRWLLSCKVKDTIQFWAKQNGCPVQAQVKESGNIVNERYSPCAQDTAVELYTIVGGEHAWPGGESVSEEIGAPTAKILATPLIWEFFTAHPMP